MTLAFDDWKERARQRDILDVARELGATLRRAGGEWIGPCPGCGGTDRFGINPKKRIFICRGAAGGDVISLVEHVTGRDFVGACEWLTGEAPPKGVKNETPEQKAARERAHAASLKAAEKRRAVEAEKEVRRVMFHSGTAKDIWKRAQPIKGTLVEAYLRERGIDFDLGSFKSLRFAELPYPEDGKKLSECRTYPCLIAAVANQALKVTAIWRIYLETKKGKVVKADVPNPKLGLGPAAGGAVWLGRPDEKVNICEGVETALGVVGLTGGKQPVAACLSTSGLMNFEPPEGVKRILIWPDSDPATFDPRKLKDGRREMRGSPGLRAAVKAAERLSEMGLTVAVQPSPRVGADYLDVWNSLRGAAA